MRGFAPYAGLMIAHLALERSNRIIFAKRVKLGACYEKDTADLVRPLQGSNYIRRSAGLPPQDVRHQRHNKISTRKV